MYFLYSKETTAVLQSDVQNHQFFDRPSGELFESNSLLSKMGAHAAVAAPTCSTRFQAHYLDN
jgi:hypothetical protein